jgi:predicted RNase H-like nuclease
MSSIVRAFVLLPRVASGRRHPVYRSTRRKFFSRDSKKFNVPYEIYQELQDKSVPSEIYKELQHKSVPIALYEVLQDKLHAVITEWRKDTAAKITEIEKLKV